jgi:hypothetical protein
MELTVLTIPDCPNAALLDSRLAEVIADRVDVTVTRHVITDLDAAAHYGMHGSPTVLVDGADPFAAQSVSASEQPSVSCRLYDTGGVLEGAPSVEELRAALEPRGGGSGPDALLGLLGRAGAGRLAPEEGGLRAVQQAVLRSFAETGAPPVGGDLARAAAPSGQEAAEILAELHAQDFLQLDAAGHISAAYPFSGVPTAHKVRLPGGTWAYSMCAIDALGIPAMLGSDADITSTDPVTGAEISVSFRDGTATWRPESAVVLLAFSQCGGPAAEVCCTTLNFFTSSASAESWAAAHPDTPGQILSHAEAEALGREVFGCLLS